MESIRKIFLISGVIFFSLQGCSVEEKALISNSVNKESIYWNFGQVKEGEISRHTFFFKNQTNKTLNIIDVQNSCGCTVSSVEKKKLLPSEETTIEVKFNSKGYSGNIEQFIYLHTDDPDRPIVKYTIKAEIML